MSAPHTISPADLPGCDRPVLITGCSSGIGYATAHALQQRGYRVFATARSPEDVSRLQAEGLNAHPLDLADSASITLTVNWMLGQTQGHVYAVFNNGAYGQPGAVEDLNRSVLRDQFETNVFGTQELTNALIPAMRRQNQGRIIYNSSILGIVSMPYRGAYNASKYAIEALADTLRLELRGSGLYVSLIEPGPIRSAFRDNALKQFNARIDASNSIHQPGYARLQKQFEAFHAAVPFTLDADAVVKRVIRILESREPCARYPVTFPAYLFSFLKRVLTDSMLDALLARLD